MLRFNRRSLRTREKLLILSLFATLAFVCFGAVFYLPEDFVGSDIFKKVQLNGPEIFIPTPPVVAKAPHHRHGIDESESKQKDTNNRNHLLNDRNRLQQKILDDLVYEQNMLARYDELGPDLQMKLPDGEDSDPVARERRNKIREVNFMICYRF